MHSPQSKILSSFSSHPKCQISQKNQHNLFLTHQKHCPGSNSTFGSQSQIDHHFIVSEPKWKMLHHDQIQNQFQGGLNKYCPFCGKFIHSVVDSFVWKNQKRKIYYFAHQECKEDFINFTQFKNEGNFVNKKIRKPNIPISLGARQYWVKFFIEHPLSRIKYFCWEKKVNFNGKNLFIEFDKDQNQFFYPNVVLFPISQFKITAIINCLNGIQMVKEQIYCYVNIENTNKKVSTLEFSSQRMTLQAQLQKVNEFQEKKKLIQQSNFKYQHPIEEENIVKLNKFIITLSEWRKNSVDDENQMIIEENFQTEEKEKVIQSGQVSEQENLQYVNYLKTHTGSKEFQKKVKVMSGEQINFVVEKLLPYLQEVILNEYGNYMFQSLIGACNLEQRLKILATIQKKIPSLICQQQGTFVFQQFISYLTDEEQFYILSETVLNKYSVLCADNFANHFMRKLIQNLPPRLFPMFLDQTLKYFVEFSMNRNAVCVLKSFLRALRVCYDENGIEFLKKILMCLTMNTEQIIKNQYGNYLIQQAFELLGSQYLGGVNETIVRLFPILGCEKYSSNVLQNCIKKYWDFQLIYEELKASLNNKKILQMYRNHNGNKVLLEIMESCFYTPLKDKISSAISNDKSSKFNNNKWIYLKGGRWTGNVGTSYSSFTEASNCKKREHYNNNMI